MFREPPEFLLQHFLTGSLEKAFRNKISFKKIAEYFGVTIEYLMTGKEDRPEQKITSVSPERALDIEVEHDVDVMTEKLKNGEEVVFRFNGDTAGDEDMELIKSSLMNLCMTAKRISKQKE